MEPVLIIIIIGSLILGCVVGYITSRISKKAALSNNTTGAMSVSILRFVLDVICLVIVFVVCRVTGTNPIIPLIAAAVGLTIFGMIFLIKATSEAAKTLEATAAGGATSKLSYTAELNTEAANENDLSQTEKSPSAETSEGKEFSNDNTEAK